MIIDQIPPLPQPPRTVTLDRLLIVLPFLTLTYLHCATTSIMHPFVSPLGLLGFLESRLVCGIFDLWSYLLYPSTFPGFVLGFGRMTDAFYGYIYIYIFPFYRVFVEGPLSFQSLSRTLSLDPTSKSCREDRPRTTEGYLRSALNPESLTFVELRTG